MPRRILLFLTDLQIGGTPTVVRELAIRLRDANTEIEVACLSNSGPVADQLRAAGVFVTTLDTTSQLELIGATRRLVRLIRERDYEMVVSFLVHANTVAAMASRSCRNVRFVQSIQTTQHKPRWHWLMQAIAQHGAEHVLVPSEAAAQAAINRAYVPAEKIVVIPNAIDPNEFEREQVFAHPTIRLGFIGRLDRVKNIESLVSAMQQMSDLIIRCDIFGEGPERAHLQNLIDRSEQRGRVFLRGPVARPQDALNQMDVLVLPSIGEGFGLVLIEAMASGVPVIGAKRGAIPEIIQNKVNGLLIGYNNFDREIAHWVRELKNDSALRARLIENGLRTVREKYSWESVLTKYRKVFRI